MKKSKRIFLTGFMGAGKSTIGYILANTLGWAFYDLDREIEARVGMKITEYFKLHGEIAFRELETETLKIYSEKDFAVIALGGGAILKDENYTTTKETGVLVYLRATPEQIFYRLRYKLDRPLFQTVEQKPMARDEAMKKIQSMLDEREKYYLRADVIIESDQANVGQLIDNLVRKLSKRLEKK
ncbi:MAG: shikimate kinase [Ignavibacteria bacterium]|nr:shikimate kinase [Ignavibacteria bacterium]